ncbi:MAG: hypothetical protein U0802_17540 [Candidatus Binatia bacterium]
MLSVAALISGMMMLVATMPNLIVNAARFVDFGGGDGLAFFAFTPFGVLVSGLGILYMLFARRRLAASTAAAVPRRLQRPTMATWIERYQLAGREYRPDRQRLAAGRPAVKASTCALRPAPTSSPSNAPGRFAREILRPVAATALQDDAALLVDLFEDDAVHRGALPR